MISVDGLTFTYPGGAAPAVTDLSFDVGDGEVFGFLGPSGAGKSTTQNILIGLLRGFSGTVDVMGRALPTWGAEYYRKVGVCFELPNHYLKLTARENLEYFAALHDGATDPVLDVLALVGLQDDADKPVAAFSKGMKNRLNLARSLLHRPTLWFLDEPTSGLDPVNAVKVRELIKARRDDGVTVLVTTHDMHTAEELCDRVAFIVDGRIVTTDAPEALRREHGRRDVELRWAEGEPETFPMDGLAESTAFLDALRRPGLLSMHSQEATLEDVFVKVTGRHLA